MSDAIVIDQLELTAHLGVSDQERAGLQRLTVTLRLEPTANLRVLDDRISNTVDYARVCEFVKRACAERPRYLLETLADEIARDLLVHFPLFAVEVELRKFILPDTNFVAITLRRTSSQ